MSSGSSKKPKQSNEEFLAEAEGITPEIREQFMLVVQKIERRRKIMLLGYLIALVVIILGTLGAMAYVGMGAPGEFRGWALLLPALVTGGILWLFGRWSRRG